MHTMTVPKHCAIWVCLPCLTSCLSFSSYSFILFGEIMHLPDQRKDIVLLRQLHTLQTTLAQMRIEIAELFAAMADGHPQHMLIHRASQKCIRHMSQGVEADVSFHDFFQRQHL